MKWLKNLMRKSREDSILDQCGCVCFCPGCKDPLNDQAECTDGDTVKYHCNVCGTESEWLFDTPVPVRLK